jgi:hypothetical protein
LITTVVDVVFVVVVFTHPWSCYIAVSNTLGDGAAIAVSSLFGGVNIFVNCCIASFATVPYCKNGVAGCSFCRMSTRSSVTRARQSVVDVVGMSTFSGKNLIVFVVRIPFVSGM